MSSLSAPWDREQRKITDEEKAEMMKLKRKILTEEETDAAFTDLVNTKQAEYNYPKLDRMYADPIYNQQTFCSHSFTPSKGATPDKEGVFGFMKCRGTFFTIEEANQRSEFIIRNIDSFNPIQTSYCGRPFPVCVDTSKYVNESKEIDIRKKAVEATSEHIKEQRIEEKKEVDEIKQREQKLLDLNEQTSRDDYKEDPEESYTTMHVKKANLVYTYVETQKKMEIMREKIRSVYAEIREMDAEYPEFRGLYYNKYMEARKHAHIPESETLDNFMKYICEDAELDFEY
jgi:hypothetical protein